MSQSQWDELMAIVESDEFQDGMSNGFSCEEFIADAPAKALFFDLGEATQMKRNVYACLAQPDGNLYPPDGNLPNKVWHMFSGDEVELTAEQLASIPDVLVEPDASCH
jgi:hypothetical protein